VLKLVCKLRSMYVPFDFIIYLEHLCDESTWHLLIKIILTQASRPAGKVVMIGMGTPIQTIPISAAALREVDLIGVFRYANTYPYGISVLAGENNDSGRSLPDLSKLITHRFSGLNSISDAFKMAGKGMDDEGRLVLKVVINNSMTS